MTADRERRVAEAIWAEMVRGFYLWATNDGRAVAAELAKQEGR